MTEGIFHLGENGTLLELRPQGFISEDDFQDLLARFPRLLPSPSSDDEGERWLLIEREAGIPEAVEGSGRWSLDHLFVDRAGIPTLVEVKRSSDTRLRREVVGQMLDYAANAIVYWPIERLRSAYEARCEKEGIDPVASLATFIGSDAGPEPFWGTVKTNLQAGRVRMIFVADSIPKELQRIVEFLNGQMDPAEVLAVEVRQYVSGGTRSLVPRLIGRTAAAQAQKQPSSALAPIDEAAFLSFLRAKPGGAVASEMAEAILRWASDRSVDVNWSSKSFSLVLAGSRGPCRPVMVYETNLYMRLQPLETIPPFGSASARDELLNRAWSIPSVKPRRNPKEPSFSLADLTGPDSKAELLRFLTWLIDQISSARNSEPT